MAWAVVHSEASRSKAALTHRRRTEGVVLTIGLTPATVLLLYVIATHVPGR